MTVKNLDDMLNKRSDFEFDNELTEVFSTIERLFRSANKLHDKCDCFETNWIFMQRFRSHIFDTLRDDRRDMFKRSFLTRHEQFAKELAAMTNEQYTPDE